MKKNFLFFVMFIFAGSIFAQNIANKVISNDRPTDRITVENGASTIVAPFKIPVFAKDLEPIELGSSKNFYGVYTSGVNQVVYNPKINTIGFIHRAAPGTVSPDESGEIGLDYSLDGGATWVTDVHITPGMATNATTGRYPQLAIYAPTTDIADARFVESGPCHRYYNGSAGNPWGVTRHVDGNFSENPTVNETYSSYFTTGSNVDGIPNRVVDDADGNVWVVVSNIDENASDPDPISGTIYKFVKGTYNADGYTWEEVSELAPTNMIVESRNYVYDYNLATDPTDANKLYFVVSTVLDGDAYIAQSHPHVYTSLDAGETWSLTSTFNMNDFIDEFEEGGIPHWEGDVSAFPHVYSVDPVVDSNGKLHIFSRVTPGATDFGYYSGANWLLTVDDPTLPIPIVNEQYQHYYDITLDIEDDVWDIQYLAPKICKVESESWGGIEIRIHTQIAKNEDASEILFIWDETKSSPDSSHTAPNLVSAGYKVETDTYYAKEEITAGSGATNICFFSQASTYVIDKDGGSVEIPFVICPYVDPNATGEPDVAVANYMYIKGGEFQWLNPIISTDLEENEKTALIDPVLVYPNPVADILYIGTNAKVSLCDITGKEILVIENNTEKKEIQMSNYPAGTYIVKAYTNKGIITKKVINIK